MGNGLINSYLSDRFSWVRKPFKAFLIAALATLIYTLIAATTLAVLWEAILNGIPVMKIITALDAGFFSSVLMVTLFVTLFMYGRTFLRNWRKSLLEAEKLKRENLASQYEALKSQVNPHFLFNSLNVLSTLVYKDQDLAAKFIQQLSNVYRYVLDSRQQELVPLKTELEALRAYLFLLQIRFGKNLEIDFDIPDDADWFIPPLALQLLVENAVKHNVVSKNRPLKIEISQNGEEFIYVKNNLQLKELPEHSSKIGLANLSERYKFIAAKDILIEKSDDSFLVKLPLIRK